MVYIISASNSLSDTHAASSMEGAASGDENSPSICQVYVWEALRSVRGDCFIIHYMDDILIGHLNSEQLQRKLTVCSDFSKATYNKGS